MERTTKTFTTPGGHEVVMYDYITGGEVQEIARTAPKETEAQIEAGNKAMLAVVRSLDGAGEDLLTRILALPFADYQAISTEVQGLIDPEKKS